MLPIVVNIKRIGTSQYGDVYIGRRNATYGVQDSIWANPFPITKSCNRKRAIEKYELYIRDKIKTSPKYQSELETLAKATRLVCWCAPLPCHGDVLIKILREDGLAD